MMDLLHVRNRKNFAFAYDLAAAIAHKVYEVVAGQKVFPLSSIKNVHTLYIKDIMVAKNPLPLYCGDAKLSYLFDFKTVDTSYFTVVSCSSSLINILNFFVNL